MLAAIASTCVEPAGNALTLAITLNDQRNNSDHTHLFNRSEYIVMVPGQTHQCKLSPIHLLYSSLLDNEYPDQHTSRNHAVLPSTSYTI